MNTNEGADLRVKWTVRNPVPFCMHITLELELTDAGYVTGNYICIVCGYVAARQHDPVNLTEQPSPDLSASDELR
jgi:hypothetical protein